MLLSWRACRTVSHDSDTVVAPVNHPTFGIVRNKDDVASQGEYDLAWCKMEEDHLECFHDKGQVRGGCRTWWREQCEL